jgi:hypothetical protein
VSSRCAILGTFARNRNRKPSMAVNGDLQSAPSAVLKTEPANRAIKKPAFEKKTGFEG